MLMIMFNCVYRFKFIIFNINIGPITNKFHIIIFDFIHYFMFPGCCDIIIIQIHFEIKYS